MIHQPINQQTTPHHSEVRFLLRSIEFLNAVDLDLLLIVPQLPFEVHCDAHLILMALGLTVCLKNEANRT